MSSRAKTPGKWVVILVAPSRRVPSGPRRSTLAMGPPPGRARSEDWAPVSDEEYWERTDDGPGTRKGAWTALPLTSETREPRRRSATGKENGGNT
jgi:hypothetical protein